MTFQLLVAAVGKNPIELVKEMNINSDAIIVNQKVTSGSDRFDYNGHTIEVYSMEDKGVGLNRNTALLNATADIVLFADSDIVYESDYEEKVLDAFSNHPEADMILFNVKAQPGRETYHIDSFGSVALYNCGRYPTYSFAVKRELLKKNNISFSLLFGGGAKYSNGEDSLFIRDCLKSGMKVFKIPVNLGAESVSESTWFTGYNEKFFFDRGVLYHFLYGALAKPLSLRFLLAHKGTLCREMTVSEAYKIMKNGIKEGKNE